jgi:hypothetical protein
MQTMQGKSTSWRWTIWIACFAVLMNALAPSISHAMAAMHGVPATWEICRADSAAAGAALTAAGQPELAAVGALSKKISEGNMTPMADCGYCLPHAGSLALMPSTITGLGLVKGHALRPFLFYRAPQPLLALSAAPPRGPPAFA